MDVPEELSSFSFARQKSKLAGPVKKAVRTAADVGEGDDVDVELVLLLEGQGPTRLATGQA